MAVGRPSDIRLPKSDIELKSGNAIMSDNIYLAKHIFLFPKLNPHPFVF